MEMIVHNYPSERMLWLWY